MYYWCCISASCIGDDDCPSGRTCYGGVCMCGLDGFCDRHHKPVCGSDGVLYDSHCELHRVACIQHKRVKVDHTQSCLRREPTPRPSTPTPAPSRRRHGFNNKIQGIIIDIAKLILNRLQVCVDSIQSRWDPYAIGPKIISVPHPH